MFSQNDTVENVFRYEYGKIIAVLVNRFGPSHLENIEDAVQDALLKAMKVWGYKNPPDNPTAWLLRVACNGLIDTFRKNQKMKLDDPALYFDAGKDPKELLLKDGISDSQLKMIFACCHPSLSVEYQIILSLKLIGGFGNREIAKVLLKKEETVAKSFTRAKAKLKEEITTLDIPIEIGLQSRLFVVMRVIYLLFSEGYAPYSGETVVRRDICYEAIRLALLLDENRYCRHPNLNALIALMCFHVSRFDARMDQNMELVDLEHQDRSRYDGELIRIGISHLGNAGTTDRLPSKYHLEAAVSYYHCSAKTFEETDWRAILQLYNLQMDQQYSPIVQLNRIVPYLKVYGAKRAFWELRNFENSPHFTENALYHAIKAELWYQLGDKAAAGPSMEKAMALTNNVLEKKHLHKKLQQWEGPC